MMVMRCINKKYLTCYKEAIETFNLESILKVTAINRIDAVLVLEDENQYNYVNKQIEKIEKVAKALYEL